MESQASREWLVETGILELQVCLDPQDNGGHLEKRGDMDSQEILDLLDHQVPLVNNLDMMQQH
jgi:hypothetical protein